MDRYSAALQILAQDGEQAPAPLSSALRQTLLTNRSLALYRLGDYAVAAGDAEAALQLDATSAKAAFRATAARLMLGDGEAATRHALLLKSLASCPGGDDAASAAWAVAARHAAALEERQRRLAAHSQRPDCPAQQEAERLLAALAAEAEGEGDAELAPAALLQQLGTLLSGSIDGGGGSSKYSHSSVSLTVAEAAAGACAALERDPQGYGLLLFFLADPDPQCRQAAAAALLSAGQMGPAAGGGAGAESDGGEAAAVLWPAQVWRRLVGMAADCASSSAAVAALRLLGSAAQRDAWVRQQLLVHPLPGAEPGAPGDAPAAPVARVAAMLHDDGTLCRLSPAAVEAAAELLRLYASDAAAAAGLLHLGSRPLLALVRAAVAAEGMPAFQPAAADDSAGGAASAPAAVGSKESLEQEALQQLRKKRQAVYNAELAALQRRLLGAAAQLAGASRDLVAAEAVQAAGAGKKGVKAGPLLTGGEGCRAAHFSPRFPSLLAHLAHACLPLHAHPPRQSSWPWFGICTSGSRGAPPPCWAPMAPPRPTPSAGASGRGTGAKVPVGGLPPVHKYPVMRPLVSPLQVCCRLQGQPCRRLSGVPGASRFATWQRGQLWHQPRCQQRRPRRADPARAGPGAAAARGGRQRGRRSPAVPPGPVWAVRGARRLRHALGG